MVSTCIYSVLLVLATIFCIKKRTNVLGLFLIIVYACEGLMAIVGIKNDVISETGVRIWPYLFLITSYIIFFWPFFASKKEINIEKFSGAVDGKSIAFAYIYIACALLTVKCYLPSVIEIFTTGNWLANREAVYTGEIEYPYSNIIEYMSINATEYTSILAILIGFLLIKNKKRLKLGILLLGTVILSMFLRTMYSAARGPLVQLLLFFGIMYLFFYPEINKKIRNGVNVLLVAAMIAIVPIIYKITDSRFGTGGFSNTGIWSFSGAFSGTVNSIVYYLGHAPVTFNSGVSVIDRYAWGRNSLGKLFGWEMLSQAELGASYETNFYTFVGWLYLDWGAIGVILIGLICLYTFSKIVKKRKYDLADIYIVLFYYQTLLYGVFVIGRSYILNIVIAVAIYIFLKVVVKNKKYCIGEFKI